MRRMSTWACGMAIVMLGMVAVRAGAAKLDTSTLLGVWDGTFTNDTFHTSGTIHVATSPLGTDGVRVDWTFTGNVFGCGPVGPVGGALLRNLRSNGFTNSKIFLKSQQDDVFGTVTIKNRGTKFFGRGTHPCGGTAAKSYRGTAKLTGNTMAGTLKIKLAGSSGTAHATFSVTKSS